MKRHFHNKATGEKYWFDLETGEIEGQPGRYHQPPPERNVRSHLAKNLQFMTRAADKNPYRSPIDGAPVMNHYQHNEALKRSGCRVMEPSETLLKRDGYNNKAFCKKHGLKYTPPPAKKELEITLPEIRWPE